MLTHLDSQSLPQMVDIRGKCSTQRSALALAEVVLPGPLARLLEDGDVRVAKGPMFQTAILAGIMGAKRTSDLIPLCHPLPLDSCNVEITPGAKQEDGSLCVEIRCRVATEGKTGVEMEALTGASVAALTLYDMGKAASHGIVIRGIRLLEKTGGKNDYRDIGS